VFVVIVCVGESFGGYRAENWNIVVITFVASLKTEYSPFLSAVTCSDKAQST